MSFSHLIASVFTNSLSFMIHISAFALFTTKPMDILYPLQRAAEQSVHVETLVGETLAH